MSDYVSITVTSAGGTGGGGGGTGTGTGKTGEVAVTSTNKGGNLRVTSGVTTYKDSLNTNWTLTVNGSPFWGTSGEYSQIGSSGNPASSISLKGSFAGSSTVTSFTVKLGGFSGTAGNISIKLDGTEIGSGTLNAANIVEVSINDTTKTGSFLVMDITNISKGVKFYGFNYSLAAQGGGGDVPPVPPTPNRTLNSISVNTSNGKTYFCVGDTFGFSGITVIANYSDNSADTITTGFTVSVPDMSTSGTKTITVTYNGKTATYQITVAENLVPPTPRPTVTGISVTAGKTEFRIGDPFNSDGTYLNVAYDDGTNEQITTGFSVLAPDMSTEGVKTVTVAYEGKTATYQITVKSTNSIEATVERTYYVGDFIVASDIAVKNDLNDVVDDFVFTQNGYRFTYEDAPSGGAVTEKVFENAITSGEFGCSLKVNVCRRPAPSLISTATDLADSIMYEDVGDNFASKFVATAAYFANLSGADRNEFMTSSFYVIKSGRERLVSWANKLGKQIVLKNNVYSIEDIKKPEEKKANGCNGSIAATSAIISLLGIAGAALLISKRKEQ